MRHSRETTICLAARWILRARTGRDWRNAVPRRRAGHRVQHTDPLAPHANTATHEHRNADTFGLSHVSTADYETAATAQTEGNWVGLRALRRCLQQPFQLGIRLGAESV